MSKPTTLIELEAGELLAAIDRSIEALSDATPLMQQIGAVLEAAAAARFDSKRDPKGVAWAPITPATKEIYESDWFIERNPEFKGGIPGTLMERTRRLRASLTYNAGPDFVDIGTSRATQSGKWQIGLLHEFGTKKMVRRGFLTANPLTGQLGLSDEAEVLAIVNGFLGEAFNG